MASSPAEGCSQGCQSCARGRGLSLALGKRHKGVRGSRGTMAWAELRVLPQARKQQILSSTSHCWLWLFSAAGRVHLLPAWLLSIPLGWAVLWELGAAGRFVPLAFWLRVSVLENGKLWLGSGGDSEDVGMGLPGRVPQ